MDLARQFDVRFIHMHDRWDTEKFPPRPAIEEMKARYYGILAALDKVSLATEIDLSRLQFWLLY